MKSSQQNVAQRYASALFNLAKESGREEKVFQELRSLDEELSNETDIQNFLISPVVPTAQKLEALKKSLNASSASEETKNFTALLVEKERYSLFSFIVEAYQNIIDDKNGVTRGVVRSASVLDPAERSQLEKTVEKATGKKVILSYTEDEQIIGGLVAQVGSYTFDDSLLSHLNRLKEDINRRAH